MQRFVAGDRVRLRSSSHGLRVERRSSIAAVTALRFHEIVRKYGVAKMHNVVINDSSTALNLKGS